MHIILPSLATKTVTEERQRHKKNDRLTYITKNNNGHWRNEQYKKYNARILILNAIYFCKLRLITSMHMLYAIYETLHTTKHFHHLDFPSICTKCNGHKVYENNKRIFG